MQNSAERSNSREFTRWLTPAGVAGSAIFPPGLESGVYVLEFATGEEYVGQSVRFPQRFATHRRRWDDIVAVGFCPTLPADLSEAERAVVRARLAAGKTLRNLTLLSQPRGPSELNLLVDAAVQEAWLLEPDDDKLIQIDEDRGRLAQRRIKSRTSLDLLKKHPAYDQILDSVTDYVASVIPWPDQTEGKCWTLTAMPSTARSRHNRRLVTLSIQNVEMLYIGEMRHDSGEWAGYSVLNTAVVDPLPDFFIEVADVFDGYRSAGLVHRFDVDGYHAIPQLIADPVIRTAARHLAMGQLRKGRAAFARFHNDAFTDEVFARISSKLDYPQQSPPHHNSRRSEN